MGEGNGVKGLGSTPRHGHRVATAAYADPPLHPITGQPADKPYATTQGVWIWQWSHKTVRGRTLSRREVGARKRLTNVLQSDELAALSLAEAASALRVSQRTVLRMIKRGQIQAALVSSRWKITLAALKAVLDGLPPEKKEPDAK